GAMVLIACGLAACAPTDDGTELGGVAQGYGHEPGACDSGSERALSEVRANGTPDPDQYALCDADVLLREAITKIVLVQRMQFEPPYRRVHPVHQVPKRRLAFTFGVLKLAFQLCYRTFDEFDTPSDARDFRRHGILRACWIQAPHKSTMHFAAWACF